MPAITITSPQVKKEETKIQNVYHQEPKHPQKIEEEKNESPKNSKK